MGRQAGRRSGRSVHSTASLEESGQPSSVFALFSLQTTFQESQNLALDHPGGVRQSVLVLKEAVRFIQVKNAGPGGPGLGGVDGKWPGSEIAKSLHQRVKSKSVSSCLNSRSSRYFNPAVQDSVDPSDLQLRPAPQQGRGVLLPRCAPTFTISQDCRMLWALWALNLSVTSRQVLDSLGNNQTK